MELIDREKDIYQLLLDKGCVNYYDLSAEDKKVVVVLIKKTLLRIEEIEHSKFVVLIKDNINKIDNIKDFNLCNKDIDLKIKESVKRFKKERNTFLKFIAKETVVCEEDILNEYDSVIFNKCISYIKQYKVKNIALYHLNPLGYKAICSEYDNDTIEIKCLKYLNNYIVNIGTDTNYYLKIIKILRTLEREAYINIRNVRESEKYQKYLAQMKRLKLVDFLYGKNYKLMFLTEKGFNIVADMDIDYTLYIDFVDAKIKQDFSKSYILYEEQLIIKKLISYQLVEEVEFNNVSKNLKEFLKSYIVKINFLDKEYICLKGQFYIQYGIYNQRSNLINSALELLSRNNVENTNDLDDNSKHTILTKITNNIVLDKTLNEMIWNNDCYSMEIKDALKNKMFLDMAILIYNKILDLRSVGDIKYIIITKKGCKYFNIPEYGVSEDKIVKGSIEYNKIKNILVEIYNQKLISKTNFEKLYGKGAYINVKNYVEEYKLNGYRYIALNNDGCRTVYKKYIPSKNILNYKFILDKTSLDVDIVDKVILNFIYKYNFIKSMELTSLIGNRFKKLLSFGLINRLYGGMETIVSKKGCRLIEQENKLIDKSYIKKFSKKMKAAKIYFFKKELASELIKLLYKEEVVDKDAIRKRCYRVLNSCNDSLDKKNQNYILTKHEEKILYTIWQRNLCVKENSLNKDIVEKFKKYGVINNCKGGQYLKINDGCTIIIKKINHNHKKIYPIIQIGNDYEYTILNSGLILKKYEDIKVDIKETTKEKTKGRKQLSVEHYKNSVKYLFNGVNGTNLKQHIEFLQNGKYIIFDTEFSTTKGDKSNMIEISAIKVDKLKIVDEFSYLIRDHEDMLTKHVSKLTKINKDMLTDEGFGEEYVLNKFIEFIEDLPVIAHAIENDWHSCVLLGCENNNIPLPCNQIVDSFSILHLMYPKERCGLDGLISKFKLRTKDIPRHRALGDSIYTLNIIKNALDTQHKKRKTKIKTKRKVDVELVKRKVVDVELVEKKSS